MTASDTPVAKLQSEGARYTRGIGTRAPGADPRSGWPARPGRRIRVRSARFQILSLLFLGAALVLGGDPSPARGQGTSDCTLGPRQTDWIQTSLDGWEQVNREVLQLPPAPLPWIILFDSRCAWHLAPDEPVGGVPVENSLAFHDEAVVLEAQPHGDTLTLPDGREVPAAPLAFTALQSGDTSTYSVAALPEIWRAIPGFEADVGDAEAFVRGLFVHELVHTRHLVPIARRIEELQSRHDLPEEIDDDMIQKRFADVPGYRAAYRAERDLLYEAAAASDDGQRRELLNRALALVRERRERYFVGPDSVYAQLEDLFLAMEGVAVWGHYSLHRQNPEQVSFVRTSREPAWTQDEGYVLFLLLDAVALDWRARIFTEIPTPPFQLLEEALTR